MTVELDDAALSDLRSDARYYADPLGWEPEYRHLVRAAQATLRALEQ